MGVGVRLLRRAGSVAVLTLVRRIRGSRWTLPLFSPISVKLKISNSSRELGRLFERHGDQIGPDGKVKRSIPLPAKQISSLAFGGPDLTDIFITSAAKPEPMPVMPPDYDPAKKLEALSSHDLEDLMAVVDGRVELVEEIHAGAADVRAYIAAEIRKLLAIPEFLDALQATCSPTKRARLASRYCWND